jgi:integrase
LRGHVLPFFADYQLHEVTPQEVQRFVASIKWKPNTVRNAVNVLRSVLREGCKWGYLARNPAEAVILPRRDRGPVRVLGVEQMQKVIQAASEPYRTLYWVAAETGLRAGELFALRLNSLNLEEGVLFVAESVWEGKFQSTKTSASVRSCDISPKLVEHLRVYLAKGWHQNDERLLFPSPHGRVLRVNNFLRREFHPLLDRLNILHCGLHAFRHGNETQMDVWGVPFKVRQLRLGHTDARTTMNYTHARSQDGRRVAAQFGEVLRPNAPNLGVTESVVPTKSKYVQ